VFYKQEDENSKYYRYGPHILLTIAKSSDQVGKFFHIITSIKLALQSISHLLISFTTGILAAAQKSFSTLAQGA